MFGSVYQGCTPGGGYRLPEEQQEVAIPLLSSSFEAAWKRNTLILGPGSSQAPGSFPMPGGGRGEAAFPLTVQATVMDSALVDAGIREFAGIAGIDTNSLEAYRATYLKHHGLEGCVLVYVDMQTFLAEDYLEANRWVFFVEDEHRNQVEPIRIVQHPVQRQAPRPRSPYGAGSRVGFKPVKRILELLFPLQRLPQMKNTIEGFRSLKFVVLDINNSQVRAEGAWDQGLAQ
jgi:hypothetical protein